MTVYEAFIETLVRDGETPERAKRRIENMTLKGVLPPHAFEQIPPGEEEAFIARQQGKRREVDFAHLVLPPEKIAEINKIVEARLAKRRKNN